MRVTTIISGDLVLSPSWTAVWEWEKLAAYSTENSQIMTILWISSRRCLHKVLLIQIWKGKLKIQRGVSVDYIA